MTDEEVETGIASLPAEVSELLSTEKQRALVALVGGETQSGAAKVAGVNASSVSRWLREPAFSEILGLARADAFRALIERLQGSAGSALSTIQRIARGDFGDANAAGVQLRAALAIFDRAGVAAKLPEPVKPPSETEIAKRIGGLVRVLPAVVEVERDGDERARAQ